MKVLFSYHKTKFIIAVVVFVLAIFLLLPAMQRSLMAVTKANMSPDTTIGYTIEALKEMRTIYGPAGANRYFTTRFTYDIIWSAIYVFFIINVYTFLLREIKCKWLLGLQVLPFIAVGFDLLENLFCSIYFFQGYHVIGLIAAAASLLKWCILLLIFISFGLLIAHKIYRKFSR